MMGFPYALQIVKIIRQPSSDYMPYKVEIFYVFLNQKTMNPLHYKLKNLLKHRT